MTYATIITIDPQRVQDMIVGAFEGGSNYWLGQGRVELIHPERPKNGIVWYGDDKINVFADPDFKVTIDVPEDELYTLDAAAITRGVAIMTADYPRHMADLLSENDDGETSDVFLQCALFGEVTYG